MYGHANTSSHILIISSTFQILMQGSDFVEKAVDIAANELLTVALPGKGRLPGNDCCYTKQCRSI